MIFVPIAHLSLCKAEAGCTIFSAKMPYSIPPTAQGLYRSLWLLTVLSSAFQVESQRIGLRGKFLQWGSRRERRLSRFATFLPWLFQVWSCRGARGPGARRGVSKCFPSVFLRDSWQSPSELPFISAARFSASVMARRHGVPRQINPPCIHTQDVGRGEGGEGEEMGPAAGNKVRGEKETLKAINDRLKKKKKVKFWN